MRYSRGDLVSKVCVVGKGCRGLLFLGPCLGRQTWKSQWSWEEPTREDVGKGIAAEGPVSLHLLYYTFFPLTFG